MNKIQFEIWCIRQDNMRRSENIDRSNDPEYKALMMENIKRGEERIAELMKNLEENV